MNKAWVWCAALAAAALLHPRPASALIEAETDKGALELRANAQLAAAFLDNAEPFGVDEQTFMAFRLLGEAFWGEHVGLELNLTQVWTSTTAAQGVSLGSALVGFGGANRSDALSLRWSNDPRGAVLLDADRLFVKLNLYPVDLRLGRQPINLATTLLFTPNDVFEPFLAQTFFREFKPGVDALRVDVQLAQEATLTVYGVLGYDPKGLADDDALAAPRLGRSSVVGKATTALGPHLEVSALGGRLADRWFVGGGLQGALWDWLGVRAEGHGAFVDGRQGLTTELALELDHRFDNTVTVTVGQFYHGAGLKDEGDYLAALVQGRDVGGYLGRHYSALSVGYEISALLSVQTVGLVNWTDPSALVSAYFLYSVSDESDLALTGVLPVGRGLETAQVLGTTVPTALGSEFGSVPRTLALDFRVYW